MILDMLENSTGEYRAKIVRFISIFQDENKTSISRLSKGQMLRVKRTFHNDLEQYDCVFCYFKGGLFSTSRLEIFVNSEFVAVATI